MCADSYAAAPPPPPPPPRELPIAIAPAGWARPSRWAAGGILVYYDVMNNSRAKVQSTIRYEFCIMCGMHISNLYFIVQ